MPLQPTLQVILARLKTGSILEIIHRIRSLIVWSTVKWQYRLGAGKLSPPAVSMDHLHAIRLPETTGGGIGTDTVNRILYGHKYPFTDITPSTDTLYPDSAPDIRSLWEPARLQHVTALLIALKQPEFLERAPSIQNTAKAELLGWLRENPFPFGIHYASAMECGLRIPVLLRALLELVNLSTSDRDMLHQVLFEHGWLIRNRLSLFSSLGNHTVAESVGLIMAGHIFAETRDGKDWLKTGIRMLKQECHHQILADGGPAEQSLGYHRMVLDLYWLTLDFLENNQIYDCSGMKPRLLAGESFLQTMGDPLPSIGDSDDGHAVAPGIYPVRPLPAEDLQMKQRSCTTFLNTGLTVIHIPQDIRLTFDHGPLGMPPLYNHGHADALSFTVYRAKRPFLVDPGTFRYNGNAAFRAYFKGTLVHNTVTVDHQDQARQVTGFIWDSPYTVDEFCDTGISGGRRLSASHDGYMRLREPVRHTRSLLIPDGGGCVVVRDSLHGQGIHTAEIHYHLHPDVVVEGPDVDGWYILTNQGERVFIKVCQTALRMICGQTEPILGWYSPAYGGLEKTCVLYGRLTGPAEQIHFTTLICFTAPGHNEELAKIVEQA